MCGLAGCVKKGNAGKFVADSLERLSYRGYDSFGWSVDNYIMRCVGKFDRMLSEKTTYQDLEATSVELLMAQSGTAICHTRWATNGEVNSENTHPIQSQGGWYQVVHNGIFNLAEGDELDTKWYIDELERKNFATIGTKFAELAYELAEGDNCLIIKEKNKDELWLVARGTKCLYISDLGYVASDVNALSGYGTTCVKLSNCVAKIFTERLKDSRGMNNHDMIKVYHNSKLWIYVKVCNFVGEDENEIKIPTSSANQTTMMEEIHEQKSLLTSDNVVDDIGLPATHKTMFCLLGCGSSFNAALFGEYCFGNLSPIPAFAKYASEFNQCFPSSKLHKVLISQSGETKDILELVPTNWKPHTVITNNMSSTLAHGASGVSHRFDMGAGPEFGVAATKTFTMTCLRLLQLACRSKASIIKDIFDSEVFKGAIDIALIQGLPDVSQYKRFLFLGKGINFPIAREAALKMKEVSYVSSDAMPAAEIKHGPIALVDKDTLCVVLQADEEVRQNVNEVLSRNGDVMIIGSSDYSNAHSNVQSIVLPDLRTRKYIVGKQQTTYNFIAGAIQALLSNIVLQRLAHDNAVAHELDPNYPRSLAKSVTV